MEQVMFFEDALKQLEVIRVMEVGSEEQHKAYDEFYDSLSVWKIRLLEKYENAKHNEDQFIDFIDCPDENGIPVLVDCLKECGVRHITISSRWSDTIEKLWAFCQAGCKIEGMVEKNAGYDWATGERTKQPAFLLCVE